MLIISLSILALLITAVIVVSCFTPRTESAASSYGSDVSFVDGFSLGTYRPMLRLASQMDRKFLKSAHSEVLAACYRKIQRSLLREYLRDASKDFSRLYAIATAKALKATSDPDDLSMALFEQQMSFILLIWGIEARLLLDRFVPFGFDLRPLVAQIDALAQQTRELARPQASYQVGYQAA